MATASKEYSPRAEVLQQTCTDELPLNKYFDELMAILRVLLLRIVFLK